MSKEELVPIKIGTIDQRKYQKNLSFYHDLVGVLNSIMGTLEMGFGVGFSESGKMVTTKILFEFLKTENKMRFIKEKYVEFNNVSFPGISTEKLIDSDLLDVCIYDLADDEFKFYRQLSEQFGTNENADLAYPLINLFRTEGNEGGFFITDELKAAIEDHSTEEVSTPEQIEIAKIFIGITELYNKLIRLKVMSPGNYESLFDYVIKCNRFDVENPFTVNPKMFYFQSLRQFRPKFNSSLRNSFNDLLSGF